MLSDDFIRETWAIETGVSEQGVEWDVIGFARAIEQAAMVEALERAAKIADGFSCGTCGMDGKAGDAIRAIAGQVSDGQR